MKSLSKYFLLLSVLFLQSCGTDDDANTDCATTLCYDKSVLYFQILDSESGQPVFDNIAASNGIEVLRTDGDFEANFEMVTVDSRKLLAITSPGNADFSIQYAGEEIFTLSVIAETTTVDCCPNTVFNEVTIAGASFELEEENNIYIIKKPVRSHIISGESVENYHAFFENSKLQIDSNANSENLEIDVKTGDKLVFKLLQYEDPIAEVADDELTKILYFEVDADATEFIINSDNFSEYNAVIGMSSSIAIIRYVNQGEITGEKMNDNEWKLSLNTAFDAEGDQTNISLEETETIFTRSSYEDVWMPIYTTHLFE